MHNLFIIVKNPLKHQLWAPDSMLVLLKDNKQEVSNLQESRQLHKSVFVMVFNATYIVFPL